MTVWIQEPPAPQQGTRRPTVPHPMLKSFGDSHRMVEQCSFAAFAPLAWYWPPPVMVGTEEGCELLWTIKVVETVGERDVISAIKDSLEERYVGGLFRRVHIIMIKCEFLSDVLAV